MNHMKQTLDNIKKFCVSKSRRKSAYRTLEESCIAGTVVQPKDFRTKHAIPISIRRCSQQNLGSRSDGFTHEFSAQHGVDTRNDVMFRTKICRKVKWSVLSKYAAVISL